MHFLTKLHLQGQRVTLTPFLASSPSCGAESGFVPAAGSGSGSCFSCSRCFPSRTRGGHMAEQVCEPRRHLSRAVSTAQCLSKPSAFLSSGDSRSAALQPLTQTSRAALGALGAKSQARGQNPDGVRSVFVIQQSFLVSGGGA